MCSKKNIIMVVDDEPQIRKLFRISLESEGFRIEEATDVKSAIRLAAIVKPNILVIDLGLPDGDGKEIIESVRKWSEAPIIVCSVRDNDEQIIECLNLGADDYVLKPFNPDVLLARIFANLRKAVKQQEGAPKIINDNLVIDLLSHEVFLDDQLLSLTLKEYELLRYLMMNKGKMITHNQLLKSVWGSSHADYVQYLRVYIKQVRNKIEQDPKNPKFIITESGIGYRMRNFSEKKELS